MTAIIDIIGRQIFDSRGNPTVEVDVVLESGAEASLGDFDGATPVHFAAASGHLECLKKLVEKGNGDPNAQTESGETPGMF